MTVNLERGFRRIIWVVSITLFALGASFIVIYGLEDLDRWNRAGESDAHGPEKGPGVYVFGPNLVYQFPPGLTQGVIKQALDKVQIKWPVEEKIDIFYKLAFEQQIKDIIGIDVSEVHTLLPAGFVWVDPISFIYLPSSGVTPSVLYSRKIILQAEAKGKLTKEGQAALSKLRKDFEFPSPIGKPLTWWDWAPYGGLVVGIAILPWGIFYPMRWIVRGFKPD